jgi:hypothetical protein
LDCKKNPYALRMFSLNNHRKCGRERVIAVALVQAFVVVITRTLVAVVIMIVCDPIGQRINKLRGRLDD